MSEDSCEVKQDALGIVRWSAWGVFNIEALDRLQRRSHIKKTRAALATVDCELHCGGSTNKPYYQVKLPDGKKKAFAGPGAFQKACALVVVEITGDITPEGNDVGSTEVGAVASVT